ncbi:MAG: DUF5709 domain-containing protein [Pseudonocardiales bacterium]
MTDEELFGDTVYESGDAVDDAELLDPVDNLTGDDPDESQQTGYSPPEREPYNLRHAPTPSEARRGESLDEHLAEEVPDVSVDDVDLAAADPPAGRLVAPDEGAHEDRESEEIATDVGPAGYARTAEEAAMHVVDEPDGNLY